MKVDVRSISGSVASLVCVALRSFIGTVLVLTLAGIVLAGLPWYFLREYHWMYGTIAAVVALIEGVTAGFVLGAKRAVAMAVAHALGSLRLGRLLVRMVFERMLGVGEKDVGEGGGQVSQALKRLPLAQADELLSGAVRDVTGDVERGGWLRRKIQRRLLGAVGKYTLARFRAEGAEHGGIDLWKARQELEDTVDDVLVKKVRGGLRLWTLLVILGLPAVVAVQTLLVILLVHSKS